MKEIKRDDEESKHAVNINPDEMEREIILLTRNSKVARITAIILTLCLIVLWPWPMYGTAYIFSKPFFTGWIIIGIVWMFISFIIVGIYPIIEGRHSIISVCRKIYVHMKTRNQLNNNNTQMKMTFENSCNSNSELCL
jgi:hypothetical protein